MEAARRTCSAFVPSARLRRSAAGLLLAACLALRPGQARAQTALVNPDPLAPKLETDPNKLPRFQKSTRKKTERPTRPRPSHRCSPRRPPAPA